MPAKNGKRTIQEAFPNAGNLYTAAARIAHDKGMRQEDIEAWLARQIDPPQPKPGQESVEELYAGFSAQSEGRSAEELLETIEAMVENIAVKQVVGGGWFSADPQKEAAMNAMALSDNGINPVGGEFDVSDLFR